MVLISSSAPGFRLYYFRLACSRFPPAACAIPRRDEKKKEWRHQVVSVTSKDGRRFEQAVASEGCTIEVKGHNHVPFTPGEVEFVAVTNKHWNFRRKTPDQLTG